MCGACGDAGGTRDWYTAGVADSPAARKRAQLALAAWATRLFGPDHIRVHDLPGTVRVMVVGPTGHRLVAQGVDEVLDAVERIGGRVDWSAVADRLHTIATPDTDWEYRGLAYAVDRRKNLLT